MEDYAPLIATKGSVAYDLSATETRTIPTLNEGDRIAQLLVFRKDSLVLPEVVDKAERGEEGLGSTGK